LSIEYITSRIKLIYNFNSKTKNSIKYGFNTVIKNVQDNTNKSLLIVFMFYEPKFEPLIDVMILKTKERENIKFYLIDSSFK
jgi:hypothetical protein